MRAAQIAALIWSLMPRTAVSFRSLNAQTHRRLLGSSKRLLSFRAASVANNGGEHETTMNPSASIPVHIHPFDHNELEIIESDARKKSLHFLRHAEGFHNVNQQYRDLKNLDARLTDHGVQQCRSLSEDLKSRGLLESTTDILVVTSPLTRCLETTMYALDSLLQDKKPPIVAVESVRETVNYNCDRRRNISEVSKEFPMVDFGRIESDTDPIWNHYEQRLGDDITYTRHRESAELHRVADRGRSFFRWLAHQPQSHVIVCTHSAFLRCIKNYGYGVPSKPEQLLDNRTSPSEEESPVVHYVEPSHGSLMKANYANCELRSMTATFSLDTIP